MGKKIDQLFNWIVNTRWFKNPPRFWTSEEWQKLSAKEKFWIVYKHHNNLIGTGNGELDIFLPFLRGDFITSLAAVSTLLVVIKAPEWVFWVYPIFYVIIWKICQWWVGNELDKRDLIALQSEIGKKREIAMRELRQHAKEETWRMEQAPKLVKV